MEYVGALAKIFFPYLTENIFILTETLVPAQDNFPRISLNAIHWSE